MKDYLTDREAEYVCEIRDDGIIYLAIRGNINSKTLPKLVVWGRNVRRVVQTMHERNPKRVLVLMDHSDVGIVNIRCSGELHAILRHNKPYVTRTAIFGANMFSQAVLKMSIYITGRRNNIELFNTKMEALNWLHEIDNRKQEQK